MIPEYVSNSNNLQFSKHFLICVSFVQKSSILKIIERNICSKNTKTILDIAVAASDNDVKHFYEYFVARVASHVTPVTLACFCDTSHISQFLTIFLLSTTQFSSPSSANHHISWWVLDSSSQCISLKKTYETFDIWGFPSTLYCEHVMWVKDMKGFGRIQIFSKQY